MARIPAGGAPRPSAKQLTFPVLCAAEAPQSVASTTVVTRTQLVLRSASHNIPHPNKVLCTAARAGVRIEG